MESESDPMMVLNTLKHNYKGTKTPRSRRGSLANLNLNSTILSDVSAPNTGRRSSVMSRTSSSSGLTNARLNLPLLPGAYFQNGNNEFLKDAAPHTPKGTILKGSSRIPNIKSYYEVLTASQANIDPSHAKTPRSSKDAPLHCISTLDNRKFNTTTISTSKSRRSG
jgi:hypothetical protein